MRSQRQLQGAVKMVSLFILLATAVVASAKDGRDFAGRYAITGVVDQGNLAVITMQVQLFNHSGADVKQASVTMRPRHAGPATSSFKPVKLWRNRGEVRLRQQFTVPRHDLELWQHGTEQPSLFVVYQTAQGLRSEHYVQMTRRPVLPQ